MTIKQRSNCLKKLLFEYNIGEVLCEQFSSYWKPNVKLELLERIASYSKQSQSTVSITDSINTTIKSLFFDFCVYMITLVNEDYNLDVLFSDEVSSPLHIAFKSLFKLIPLPKLNQINLMSKHLAPKQQCKYSIQFPFFKLVFKEMEDLIQKCLESTHLDTERLYERIPTNARADPQSKLEQLVKDVLQMVQTWKDDTHKNIVGTVLHFMDRHPIFWDKYFHDFLTYKLHLGQIDEESDPKKMSNIPLQILQSFFKQLNKSTNEVKNRLVWLHCHTAVYHINLAQLATLFRHLCKVHELHLNLQKASSAEIQISTMSTTDQLVSNIQPTYPIFGSPAHISDFVITTLFETLQNSLNDSINSLEVWFSTYRDVLAIPTLREYIFLTAPKSICESVERKVLEVKLNIMQVTFICLGLYSRLTLDSWQTGNKLFKCLCEKYLCEAIRPGIAGVFEIISELLLSGDNCLFKSNTKTVLNLIEGLLSHYFSPYLNNYDHDDVKWFLVQINNCTLLNYSKCSTENCSLKEDFCVQDLWGLVEFNMYKMYVSHILGSYSELKGNETGILNSSILLLYNKDMRDIVSSVLCSVDKELGPRAPYIPLHYKQHYPMAMSGLMEQPLCHLYYNIVLEHITSDPMYQNVKPSELISMVRDMQAKLETYENADGLIDDSSELIKKADQIVKKGDIILLRIDIQAVVQLLIKKIAAYLNPIKPQQIGELQSLLKNLNRVLDGNTDDASDGEISLAHGHGHMLIYHLLQELRSFKLLIKYCTQENNSLRSINCLIPILRNFKKESSSKPLLSSYLQNKLNGRLNKAYVAILQIMSQIHINEKNVKDFSDLAEALIVSTTRDESHKEPQKYPTSGQENCSRLEFRMLVWFVIYYEFYSKERTSTNLCKAMDTPELSELIQSNSCIRLFKCFLDPVKMKNTMESLLPLSEHQLQILQSEGLLQELQPDEQKLTDPIYDLFHNDKASNIDLKHALANIIGVILGISPQSNHLWNQLFAVNELRGTYMTGSMSDIPVAIDGHHYDQAVDCSIHALYERQAVNHAHECSFSLHSLSFLLWANFGTFCMSVLTQEEASSLYHEYITSNAYPLRNYCYYQLQTLWISIRNNLNISNEERSYLFMQATWNLFEIFSKSETDLELPINRSTFSNVKDLKAYEKTWHSSIFQPALMELPKLCANVEDASNHQIKQDLEKMAIGYRSAPSLNDFLNYVHEIGELSLIYNDSDLHVLATFVMKQEMLEIGGQLLPDLIEFYNWLHSSFTVKIDQAIKYTIGIFIKKFAERNVDKKFSKQLIGLYERVKLGCNKYLQLWRLNKCLRSEIIINDETTLICLLSSNNEETEGKDWIYKIIEDIINCHNQSIKHFYSLEGTVLPSKPALIRPTEVKQSTAIFTDYHRKSSLHGIDSILHLIRRCYRPAASAKNFRNYLYDFDKLKHLIVMEFIIGRPVISSPTLLRITFKFHQVMGEKNGISLREFTNTELNPLAKLMPEEFKIPLTDNQTKSLEYEFHSIDYRLLYEIVNGLKNTIHRIIQDIREEPEHGSIQANTVKTYLQKLHNEKEDTGDLLKIIGIENLKPLQVVCLSDLPLVSVFSCLHFFSQWIEDGSYNFHMVPLSLKQHMLKEDIILLESVCDKWNENKRNLLDELDHFIEILKRFEKSIIQRIREQPDVPIKRSIGLIGLSEELIGHVSDTITLKHYKELRLVLLKLWLKTDEELKSTGQYAAKCESWKDDVIELWKEHLPEIRVDIQPDIQKSEEEKNSNENEQFPKEIEEHETGKVEKTAKFRPEVPAKQRKTGKLDKHKLAEWLIEEAIDEDDVKLLKERGVNERLFLKLEPGDKKLEGITEATIEQLEDLQNSLRT